MNPRWMPSFAHVLLMLFASLGLAAFCPAAEQQALSTQVSEGPSLPQAVGGHAGGIVSGMPVVVGGTSWSEDRKTKSWHAECFILKDGKWTTGPSLPRKIADPAYAWTKGGLYIAGGSDGTTPLRDVYHLAGVDGGAEWRALTPLPEPLDGAGGAAVGETFYIVGGFNEKSPSNKLWSLNLAEPNARWKSLAPLPADGRAFTAFAACGKFLYLFGGVVFPPYHADTIAFSDTYRYDPAADKWERLKLEFSGYAWSATAIDDQTIMITGRAPEPFVVSDEIWAIDVKGDNPTPRAIGRQVTPSCCMPAILIAPMTWMLPGGEPDTNRSRTNRTSIVRIEATKSQ